MTPLGLLAALWGAGGVIVLCGSAVVRLAPLAWEPIAGGELTVWHWVLYAGSIVFNGYAEGYKAFQKGFAPRVAARALHLARTPEPLHVVLAPAFCMGLFHATRRRVISAWVVLFGVAVLVVIVKLTPQPWRGIIDAGVVVGLAWGTGAVVVYFARALAGRSLPVPADLPVVAAD